MSTETTTNNKHCWIGELCATVPKRQRRWVNITKQKIDRKWIATIQVGGKNYTGSTFLKKQDAKRDAARLALLDIHNDYDNYAKEPATSTTYINTHDDVHNTKFDYECSSNDVVFTDEKNCDLDDDDDDHGDNDEEEDDAVTSVEKNPGMERFSYVMKTCYQHVLSSGLQLVGLVYASSFLHVKIIPYQLELIICEDDKYGSFCILKFIGKPRLVCTVESHPWFKREVDEPIEFMHILKHISQFQQQYQYAHHKYSMLEM